MRDGRGVAVTSAVVVALDAYCEMAEVMTRKSWMKPPQSDTGRPGSVKATTLADVARPDRKPKPVPQCAVCLEPETWSELPGGGRVSSLRKGTCRDLRACENRQPPLIPLGEL